MKKKGMFVLILAMLWISTISVFAETTLPTDVAEASSGCTLLGIEGKYIAQIPQALERINKIRKEACQEGIINPSTGQGLTPADYEPIKWSSDLEYIARIRAAEASLTMDHVRTNGRSCFSIQSPRSVRSTGEVVARNWSETMLDGINQWYSEKKDWVNKNSNAVTGHYTQMIDPENHYVGLGTFCTEASRYYNTTVGEFSSLTGLDETQGTSIDNCIQIVEVNNSYLYFMTILGPTTAKKGDHIQYDLRMETKIKDYSGNFLSAKNLRVMEPVAWLCSVVILGKEIATIDSYGNLTAKTCGDVQITAMIKAGRLTGITLNVEHTEVIDNATAATCTTEGKTEGSHCSGCGLILKEQTTIPALGHNFTRYVSNGDATELKNGTKTAKCTRCDVTNTIEDVGSKLTPAVKVTTSVLPLKVGQNIASYKVTMSAGDYVKSWESNNRKVVKVSGKSNGTCTIKAQQKTGTAKITATFASGKKHVITVKVQKTAVATTKISGLKKSVTVKKGKKLTLKPVIEPISSKQKVTYSTSNKKVAAVTSKGVIKGIKAGTAKITVKSGSVKYVVTVNVKK